MGYDIVIQFKKPFVKCIAPFCKNKHYAKGYCLSHYNKIRRKEYQYTLKEYSEIRKFQDIKNRSKPL